MLKERQLVGAVAGVAHQLQSEVSVHRPLVNHRRPANRVFQLAFVHRRHEILGGINRLGETGEARAIPQVVGTHRERDVDVVKAPMVKINKKPNKIRRPAHSPFNGKAKNLLELVDQDKQALLIAEAELAEDLGYPVSAPVQAQARLRGLAMIRHVLTGQRTHESGGKMPHRRAARHHRRRPPIEPAIGMFPLELCDDASTN